MLLAAFGALTAGEVHAKQDAIVQTYLAMYDLPTNTGPRFATMLVEHATRAGFRLCLAIDHEQEQPVGFGYGFTGQPGQAWRDSLAAAMGAELARQWLRDYFEFAEFGVIPAWRQRGVGGRLHDTVLRDLPHRRAVLTVRQSNETARAFYARRGWVALYDGFYALSGRGPYVVMGRELAAVR